MPSRVGYPGTEASGDVLTTTNFNKMPGGLVAYSTPVTTATTSIGTSITDVTSLVTSSFTAGTSRLYVVYAKLRVTTGTAGAAITVVVRDDANNTIDTVFALNTAATVAAGSYSVTGWTQPWFPTAGAHTAKVSVTFGANANNQAGGVSATDTAWIGVYDYGVQF